MIQNKNLNYQLELVKEPNSFLEQNMFQKRMALDTETNSLNPFQTDFKVGCITLTFDGITGYYLPFEKINKRLLCRFLKGKDILMANPKFDILTLYNCGVLGIKASDDINMLFHVLNTSRKSNSLKALAWLIGFGGYDEELEKYKNKYKIKNYLDIPESILSPYATLDAIVTYRLVDFALKELVPKQPEVYKMYKEILIPVIDVFVDMEIEGIPVDIETLNKLNTEFTERINKLEIEIKKTIKGDINIGSPEQVGIELKKLGLPCYGKTEKGIYETGDDALQRWKKDGYEIADLILQHRTLSKLQSGFLGDKNMGIEEEENSFFDSDTKKNKKEIGIVKSLDKDNKIHPNYGIARTEPLRQMCSNPNAQNFPKDKVMRTIFKLSEDYIFGEFDIAGFHLRLMAYKSNDPVMKDVFINQSGDLHSMTARSVFTQDISFEEFLKRKKEELYSNYRFEAKGINFLFLYNGSPFLLKPVIEMNWTEKQIDEYIEKNNCEIEYDKNGDKDLSYTVAKDIHSKFMTTYKNIPIYAKQQIKKGSEQGYIDSELGSRRHLPELLYKQKELTKEYYKLFNHNQNICTNTEILSMEALMMHKAMFSIHKELKERGMKSKLIIMVHDSVVLKIYIPELEEVKKLCLFHLQNFKLDDVPIVAEDIISDVWGFK